MLFCLGFLNHKPLETHSDYGTTPGTRGPPYSRSSREEWIHAVLPLGVDTRHHPKACHHHILNSESARQIIWAYCQLRPQSCIHHLHTYPANSPRCTPSSPPPPHPTSRICHSREERHICHSQEGKSQPTRGYNITNMPYVSHRDCRLNPTHPPTPTFRAYKTRPNQIRNAGRTFLLRVLLYTFTPCETVHKDTIGLFRVSH